MSEDRKAVALDGLRRAMEELRALERERVQVVVDARHLGVTWQKIANELGVGQPNATRKYKPAVDSRPPRDKWDREADPKGAVLAAVRAAAAAIRKVDEADVPPDVQAVADARTAGATWQEIAEVLGMQQPNAVARYAPLLEREHRVSGRPRERRWGSTSNL